MGNKKTNADFKREVFSIVGNEYTFLDAYQGALVKIKVKHNKCGNIYKVKPNNFLNGQRCPYCSRHKTNEQFKQEVFNLVGSEYTFLDVYVNNYTKIRIKHNKCGNIYKVKPSAFLSGSRCPYCAGLTKKTDDQFRKEVYNLVGNEYIFLDKYVNLKTKLGVKHNKCGNIYTVTPSEFLHNHNRCPYCAINAKKTDAQFKKEVFNLVGNEYVFLDEYTNNKIKLRVKHNKCGHVYKVQPSAFFSGARCPYCNGNHKKTNTEFKQEVYDLVDNEYTFLDTYIDSATKLRVKHNKCGNVYMVKPANFLQGKRCPYCNSPKGEFIISKILDTLNINYDYQKSFNDLKDTGLLSYDFYLPDQNILIEYQGIQHYEPVAHFGGENKFKLQQKHDRLKSDYAKDHNYNLIAIPYTEDTFSKIKKYLLQHGLTR